MKIIVIGMDNSGKTTLCNKLAEKFNLEHVKSPGPQLSKEEMVNWMNEQLNKENIIIERFPYIEEMVYGKVLRGKSKFTFKDKINLSEATIIYCKPSKFVIGDKEEMDGVIENASKLRKRWRFIIRKLNNVIKYDYHKDPEAENVIQ